MKNLKLLFLATITLLTLNSCTDAVEPMGTNYVTFSESTYSTAVDVGATKTLDVTIYTANISNADRSFDVTVDQANSTAAAGSYTVPTSVTIPAGKNEGILAIELSDVNLGIGVNTIILNFAAKAGLSNGGTTTVSFIQNCTEITGTLDIVFDGYGSETSWEILDSLGGVVMSAAEKDYTDGQVSASIPVTLCSGRDFTFTIKDAYGDGLSYPNNGTYTLTVNGTVKAQGGGDFGSSESTAFDTK